jgi:hypothetical protein
MGVTNSDKVVVEHLFVLSVSAAWEEPLRKLVVAWGEGSQSTMKAAKVFGYAAAAYLVLSGVSKVIDSLMGAKRTGGENDDGDDQPEKGKGVASSGLFQA